MFNTLKPENKIKAIILDLGNVLVEADLNFNYKNEFEKIGIIMSSDFRDVNEMHSLILEYRLGKINSRIFAKLMSKAMNIPDISFEKFNLMWNGAIIRLFKKTIEYVKILRLNGYKLYLLSDTDEMHFSYIEELYKKWKPNEELRELFDKCYLSYLTGCNKADDEAWLQILREQKLNPEECIFADDLLCNIDRAKKLGIKVFHYKPENNLQDIEFLV